MAVCLLLWESKNSDDLIRKQIRSQPGLLFYKKVEWMLYQIEKILFESNVNKTHKNGGENFPLPCA